VPLGDGAPPTDEVPLGEGDPLADDSALADGDADDDAPPWTSTSDGTETGFADIAVADLPEGTGIGTLSGTAAEAEYLPHCEGTTYDGRCHGQDLADCPDIYRGKDRTGRPGGHDCSPAIHCRIFSFMCGFICEGLLPA
jgi:hypothetical protein